MAPELKNSIKPITNLLELCAAVAQASPLPTVGVGGATHVIRYVNTAFCELTNRLADELIGLAFSCIPPGGDACLSLLDRVYETNVAETHMRQERIPFGSFYWSYAAWPVLAHENHEPGMILLQVIKEPALHQDAVAANEALTLSLIRQHELIEAAELANTQLKAEIAARGQAEKALIVSEKLASVGRMAAVISHEINNPLAAVMDLLYLVQTANGTPDEALEYLRTADEELKRIAHITRQTLGFYREMSSPTSFRVLSLLTSVLDLLQAKIKSKRALVKTQCDEQLKIDSAIYGELRQVVSNFLVNSLDALEEEGSVTVRASTSFDPSNGKPRIRITVADNGHGIAPSVLPQIFEPFFTTKGEIGNGLGLWVSKQIIDNHGGAVQFRSSIGGSYRGTAFSIILPSGSAA